MNFKRKTSHADPYLFFHGINLIATGKFAILESRKKYQKKNQYQYHHWEWWVCLYKVLFENAIGIKLLSFFSHISDKLPGMEPIK